MNLVIPKAFILKRLHSLMGFWLMVFLCEHLLANSQAALFFGENFVSIVNRIQSLPFLHAIEWVLIGVPIVVHMVYGIYILRTGQQDKMSQAYTWQRITSWILLIGIIGHVVQMRFIDYPVARDGVFIVKISADAGLDSLAKQLNVQLIEQSGHVVAVADSFGKASLLVVRDTFKSPIFVALYTVFVLSAAYHAFRGLWTFLISWGMTVKVQKVMVGVCIFLMLMVALLGLTAIWGSYLW